MICPRCESFAALVGELTLDRDHLRNELNKRKGDPMSNQNPDYATRYGHCSGCTDPRSEGTHCMGTIEHPSAENHPQPGVVEQIRAVLHKLYTAPMIARYTCASAIEDIKRIIDSPPSATGTTIPEPIGLSICPACDRKFGQGTKRCPFCGELKQVADSPPSAQEQPASTPATTTPPASATESCFCCRGTGKVLDPSLGELLCKHCTEPQQSMVKVAGKPFHCECGGNVFTKAFGNRFICNSCMTTYIGQTSSPATGPSDANASQGVSNG